MQKRTYGFLAILLLVILLLINSNVLGSGTNRVTAENNQNVGYGFMGMGSMMGGYGMYGDYQSTNSITEQQADEMMESSLKQAVINKEENTIRYEGEEIKLTLLAGPEIADGKFVIGDLINPTIIVPKGADVQLNLINEDEGMPHGIEITSAKPPYSTMSMMDTEMFGGSSGAFLSPIPEAGENAFPFVSTDFTPNDSGEYYYICQYPGHAAKGMYGKIIFE